MSQKCSYTEMDGKGMPQGTDVASSVNWSKSCLIELTGPATTVSSGMTISSISSVFPTHIYGGVIVGSYQVTSLSSFRVDFRPSSTYSTLGFKVIFTRLSTGARMSSAVDMSGYSWIAELRGY